MRRAVLPDGSKVARATRTLPRPSEPKAAVGGMVEAAEPLLFTSTREPLDRRRSALADGWLVREDEELLVRRIS